MKRSEIYLKAAKEMEQYIDDCDPRYCGCYLLDYYGDIGYEPGSKQVERIKKYAPEYYLFRPKSKWDGVSPFPSFKSFNENTNWRHVAFLFAHEIAKSEGN